LSKELQEGFTRKQTLKLN